MNPAMKRFVQRYQPVYDAVASSDISQTDRDLLAADMGARLREAGAKDFIHDTFVLLASDPLCPCAGFDRDDVHYDCPNGTIIRVGMHLRSAPDGKAASWMEHKPAIRCVGCGARHFNPDYPVVLGDAVA